jgi:hypothetical protein
LNSTLTLYRTAIWLHRSLNGTTEASALDAEE